MRPQISVIVPICNAEQYLCQCIESILKQSLNNIEVICVNDGSKDNSLSIMRKFSSSDSRIKIIDKCNSGYGDSVNCGLEIATGEYIGIVESDDFIAETMYEELYKLTQSGKADIVKGNFWDYYDYPGKKAVAVTNTERKNMPKPDKMFTIREEPNIMWGHPSVWSAIYRTNFLKENNIQFLKAPGGGWVDNPFFFETLCLAKSICWTDKPLYYYRKTNANSSSNNQPDLTLPFRRMMDNLDVLEKYHHADETSQKFAYARALMYMHGAFSEKNYWKQTDKVRPYAKQLMERLNSDTINNDFNIQDQASYYKYLSPLNLKCPTSGKVLIYNWVPFDNPSKIGGGVTIYCYNLISTILKNRPDIQVFFLSSGWAYDIATTECYVRATRNVFGDRCRSFEIVNSPVPAAQNMILNSPVVAISNPKLKLIFKRLIADCGGFDVIHFNNIEGLSLDTIDIKEECPETTFIYSMHNYVPICATGFYYQRHNKCNCNPDHSDMDCLKCTEVGRRYNLTNEIVARAINGKTNQDCIPAEQWINALDIACLDRVSDPQHLIDYCKSAIRVINRSMDYVLAVSECVKRIAIQNGIDPKIVQTSYIGTKIAEYQIQESIAPPSDYFKVAYLGSDILFEEKGYPFLVKSLGKISAKDAAQMDLFLTTTNGNPEEIKKMLPNFHKVEVKKGYSHSELKEMLKDVHLGIVPVLWEDNLPQIAIEMVAIGVPILCSSFGGASELCQNKAFRFEGGNETDLINKLLYLKNNQKELQNFWRDSSPLITMDKHWAELENLFNIQVADSVTFSLREYGLLLQENDFLYRNLSYQTNGWAENELNMVRKSATYKIGRIITFGPRMIRGCLRCYKENGLNYTIGRIVAHLKRV